MIAGLHLSYTIREIEKQNKTMLLAEERIQKY